MIPFAAEMHPDLVTFTLAAYATGKHAGVLDTKSVWHATLPGYVEATVDSARRQESASPMAEPTPRGITSYRVFTGSNPSAALDRPIQTGDQVTTDGGLTLQVLARPTRQGIQWVTKCEMVS